MNPITWTSAAMFLWGHRKAILLILNNAPGLIKAAGELRKPDGTPEEGEAKRKSVEGLLRETFPIIDNDLIHLGVQLAFTIMRFRGFGK